MINFTARQVLELSITHKDRDQINRNDAVFTMNWSYKYEEIKK